MSANPTNPRLELANLVADSRAAAPQTASPVSAPGREALQALLAFSSLHEQIRQRRAREVRNGARLTTEDVWELEQFVLDEVLQLVAERALAITGADGVAIALAEGNAIICRASAGTIAPDSGVRLDPNSGFSGACLRAGRIVRCDDAQNDPRVNLQACMRLGTRSMVAVPLAAQQSVIGLLEAFSSDAYAFNDSDVRSLNLLAELILSAMRPEEEDRLAEISRQVVARAAEPIEIPQPEFPNGQVERVQVREESREPEAVRQTPFPAVISDHGRSENSRRGLAVVLLLGVLAAALGGGLWWKIRHSAEPATASSQPVASVPSTAQPENAPAPPEVSRSNPAPVNHEQLSLLPQVTGIRHWSSADSSTVVVDLQDQVQYEAHRLSDPERIYFDLHDTSLAPGLFGKSIEVRDALLKRVRIAQPVPGVTRVVLETRADSVYSVSLESNPNRLVVEVRPVGAAPPKAEIELFGPQNHAAIAKPRKKVVPVLESVGPDNAPTSAHGPQFRIVLDAGHGGWDQGTIGRKGLMEKDLVLDIVERVGNLVESRLGAEVVYTRDGDNYVALEKRAEIANLSQADLFLSVHANYSSSPSARGVETYYTNTYSSLHARTRGESTLQNVNWTNVDIREKVQESRRIAGSVQAALFSMLAAKNPGIRDRGVKEASYVVLTGTSMPAVLAEVSFVSSPTDEANLQSSAYRQQIANALYKGIARYAEESRRVRIASTSGKPTGR
jgi:N-acetylmuramoyl-L-alanine amidase/putative methionine-R-sulfoxide reductase with GAF domain